MLNAMRKGAKSWPGWIVASLVIVALTGFGIDAIFTTTPLGRQVAVVGDAEVTGGDLATALTRARNQLIQAERQAVSWQDMRARGVGRDVLDGLIRDAAISAETSRLGVRISDAAIDADITANPSFHDGEGRFNAFRFQQILAQNGFDQETFRRATGRVLEQRILASAIAVPAADLPGIGARVAAYRGETRTISTIILTLDMADDPGSPDEATLGAWFTDEADRFREPNRRWGRYLHVDMAAIMADSQPEADAVRAEYDANIARYTVPATRTVEQIVYPNPETAAAALARLGEEGVTFADLAAEAGVAEADLSLGQISAGDLPPTSSAAVFDAGEIGVIGPVATGGGAALFNLVSIEAGGPVPFETLEGALTEALAREAARARAPELARAVSDRREEGQALERIADETGLTVLTFDGLARGGQLADRSRATGLMAQPVFTDEVFEALDGEERDLIQTDDGSYFVVEVDRIEPAHLPALADIRGRVADAWRREQRLVALETRAETIVAALSGTPLAEQAETLGLAAIERPAMTRLEPSPDLAPDLVDAIFAAGSGAGAAGRAASGAGVIVAEVGTITPLSPDDMAAQTEDLGGYLTGGLARDTLEYFARAIETGLSAERYPQNIDGVYEYLGGQSAGPR